MKIVVLTQQTAFVRHWFRWYRVQRAGEDWRKLEIGKQYEKPKKFDIEKVARDLGGKPAVIPGITDKKESDEAVQKVLKKQSKKHKAVK